MKRKTLFLIFGIFLLSIFLSLSRIQFASAEGTVTETPLTEEIFTPTQTATPTFTITATYTSTPTVTLTSTITFTPTATFDTSQLYPPQDDDSNTQEQLDNIQDAIAKLQDYIETSQPDNSQIQDALNAIQDSLLVAEQEAKIDKLKQNIIGWIQFSIGLILGALLGWINIEPPLPAIRRDLLAKKFHQVLQAIKNMFLQKSVTKKVEQQKENNESDKTKTG